LKKNRYALPLKQPATI